MSPADIVPAALLRDAGVRAARLVGSRARSERSEQTALSDWDFVIDATNPEAVAARLPTTVEPMHPLGHLWDPLVGERVFMLMLTGAVKIDLFLDLPANKTVAPPWKVTAEALPAINAHFWDWTLWLASKRARADAALVAAELAKLMRHILQPLGAEDVPMSQPDHLVAGADDEQVFLDLARHAIGA